MKNNNYDQKKIHQGKTQNNLLGFSEMLLGKSLLPPPPIGIGRLHFIGDEHCYDIPDMKYRMEKILALIKEGISTVPALQEHLDFYANKKMIIADCEELSERGLIRIERKKGRTTLYFPATNNDRCQKNK